MDIVPLTIWREARGEGRDGMLAVAHVIQNRAQAGKHLWPSDPEHVCLQRKQFSCWNDTDAERDIYPAADDKEYALAENLWGDLEEYADPTNGATFYCNPQTVARNPFEQPGFILTAVIGHHNFYRNA